MEGITEAHGHFDMKAVSLSLNLSLSLSPDLFSPSFFLSLTSTFLIFLLSFPF